MSTLTEMACTDHDGLIISHCEGVDALGRKVFVSLRYGDWTGEPPQYGPNPYWEFEKDRAYRHFTGTFGESYRPEYPVFA
jgi:hypothetical protein